MENTIENRLQAATGYPSYMAYHRNHFPDSRRLQSLIDAMETPPPPSMSYCTILDVTKGEGWPVVARLNKWRASKTEILDGLQHPTEGGVRLRIISWFFDLGDRHLIDPIGLVLKLPPSFFEALFQSDQFESPFESPFDKWRFRLCPTHVALQKHFITFGQYDIEENIHLPFVLIASLDGGMFHRYSKEGLRSGQSWNPRSSTAIVNHNYDQQEVERHTAVYMDLLRHFLAQTKCHIVSRGSLQIAALFPILRLEFNHTRKCLRMARSHIYKEQLSHLHYQRDRERRSLENAEDAMDHLRSYIAMELDSDWLQEPIYQKLEEEYRPLIANARRFEAEIRDKIQIQSGVLAIEETKRSIELSNSQIEEGKRVKIFTVLAFVYIPLNLATSIFGMNLRQLNQSGPQLLSFIITAVAAVMVTGLSWFCVMEINSYLKWRQDTMETLLKQKGKYSIAVRLAMIFWLLYYGHWAWLWRTKAWRCVLLNDTRSTSRDSTSRESLERIPFRNRAISAGDYVSANSRDLLWPPGSEAKLFDLDEAPDWK